MHEVVDAAVAFAARGERRRNNEESSKGRRALDAAPSRPSDFLIRNSNGNAVSPPSRHVSGAGRWTCVRSNHE